MKYINLFNTETEYDNAEKQYPNSSYIVDIDQMRYAEKDPTLIVAKFTTTSANQSVKITGGQSFLSSIVADGEPLEISGTGSLNHTFATIGEHVVEYRFVDTTTIANNSFAYCSELTSVNIPDSVTKIDYGAFNNCFKLGNITIGNSVTSISNFVFSRCRGLTTITFPNSVTSIGYSAIEDCTGLTSITSLAATPPTIQSNTFNNVPATCPIYVPAESVADYQAAANWSTRADYIQAIP